MKRLLAPLLSAGVAVAPQTAEAGPMLFPGVKDEILSVFHQPGVKCEELAELPDRTLWHCVGGNESLTLSEPGIFKMGEDNPVRMETGNGYSLSYHAGTCTFDRPEDSLLGSEQYFRERRCRDLGILVRAMVSAALNPSED